MVANRIAKGVYDIARNRSRLSLVLVALIAAMVFCSPAQAARYAVIAGVSDYWHWMMNDLSYCDDDAWDMYLLLQNDPIWNPAGVTKPSNITLLTDATDALGGPLPPAQEALRDGVASKAAIQAAIAHYGTLMGPGDTFVFYFSGHGSNNADQAPLDEADYLDEYICPYDTDPEASDEYATMISDDELATWIGSLTAGQIVVILDTCYSGGMPKDSLRKGMAIKTINLDGPPSMDGDGFTSDLMAAVKQTSTDGEAKDIDDLPDTMQILVLTASNVTEVSYENSDVSNGLFTQYLLEAAYSTFSDDDGDGFLSGEELYDYLRPWVECYYDDYSVGQVRQNPQMTDLNDAEAELLTAFVSPPYRRIWRETFDLATEPRDIDSNPLWTHDGQWMYGRPAGMGGSSGDPDPTSGFTGLYVFGYNLAGDYLNSLSPAEVLCTPAIDCRGYGGVHVRFYRWLGVEMDPWDEAVIEVSNDGVVWNQVYRNGSFSVSDDEWLFVDLDISAYADDQPTVYIRWVMGPTDTTIRYCGWNIDDVSVHGRKIYDLTVNGGTTSGQYYEGDVVTIVADDDTNFGMWSGDVSTVADILAYTTTIVMNGNYTVTAEPPTLVDLTVTDGSGSGQYPYGTTVQIDFNTVTYSPWQFNRWTGDVTTVADIFSPTTDVVMLGTYDIWPIFNCQLIVQNGSGSGIYVEDSVVPIQAACDPALFDHWVGETGTVANVNAYSTTILLDDSYTVRAAEKNQYTLTVTDGTGSGTYIQGQVANIDSTLAPGLFDHWAGDVSTVADIYNPSTTVTMNGNYNIAAVAKNQYTLTVVNGTGSGTYVEGAVVGIASTLPAGQFDHWEGDVGTVADVNAESTTVTVNGDYTITAVAAAPLEIDVTVADGCDWVYQNTTFTLGRGGHHVQLNISIVQWGGNNSVTLNVAKVPGSGAGEIIVQDDPGGDPLIKYVQGGMRTDGVAGTGPLTIEVTATGDVSGVDTVQIPFTTLALGDINGDGGVQPSDTSVLIARLNNTPVAGISEKRYDLDLDGGVQPGDTSMLISILNKLLAP